MLMITKKGFVFWWFGIPSCTAARLLAASSKAMRSRSIVRISLGHHNRRYIYIYIIMHKYLYLYKCENVQIVVNSRKSQSGWNHAQKMRKHKWWLYFPELSIFGLYETSTFWRDWSFLRGQQITGNMPYYIIYVIFYQIMSNSSVTIVSFFGPRLEDVDSFLNRFLHRCFKRIMSKP